MKDFRTIVRNEKQQAKGGATMRNRHTIKNIQRYIYYIYYFFIFTKETLYKKVKETVHSYESEKKARNSLNINSLMSARFLHDSARFVQKRFKSQKVRRFAI